MAALLKLPYELHSLIVQHLDLADIRALSLTCKRLQFLFNEHSIAKSILEVCSVAPPSKILSPVLRRQPKLGLETGADCCGWTRERPPTARKHTALGLATGTPLNFADSSSDARPFLFFRPTSWQSLRFRKAGSTRMASFVIFTIAACGFSIYTARSPRRL